MEKLRKALLSRWEDRAPWSGTRGCVVRDPGGVWSGTRGLGDVWCRTRGVRGPGPGRGMVRDPGI